MTSIVFNLLLNVSMIVLLVVTIIYCWVLNRRIRVLQDSKGELAQLLKYFDESTQRATESVVALQNTSKKIGDSIQVRISKANDMLDDLAFMIDKGNKVADQIEAALAVQRARHRSSAPPVPKRETVMEDQQEPLRIVASQAPEKKVAPPAPAISASDRKGLEAVLNRIAERTGKSAPLPAASNELSEEKIAAVKSAARSRAENELLAMLKSSLKG